MPEAGASGPTGHLAAFAARLPLILEVPFRTVLEGLPSPLLSAGGRELGELLGVAGLEGCGALPRAWSRIHGQRHFRMVCVLAVRIAVDEGWPVSEPDRLPDLWCLWTAGCLHDLGRIDDGLDPGHAERGARVAERYLPQEGVPPERVALVARLIRSHGASDEGLGALDRIFKDADGLDRFRPAVGGCSLKLLRTEAARALHPRIRALYLGPVTDTG